MILSCSFELHFCIPLACESKKRVQFNNHDFIEAVLLILFNTFRTSVGLHIADDIAPAIMPAAML